MQQIHILLVDDNEGDIFLTKEALSDAQFINKISAASDGVEAIGFLKDCLRSVPRAMPDLILLDINLPKMDGTEVLSIIKSDPDLKRIPVIMLTTSSAEKDILASYENYANCYITKPIEVSQFIYAITKIEEFWFNIVTIPLR